MASNELTPLGQLSLKYDSVREHNSGIRLKLQTIPIQSMHRKRPSGTFRTPNDPFQSLIGLYSVEQGDPIAAQSFLLGRSMITETTVSYLSYSGSFRFE